MTTAAGARTEPSLPRRVTDASIEPVLPPISAQRDLRMSRQNSYHDANDKWDIQVLLLNSVGPDRNPRKGTAVGFMA
jgi:hypothetical protein